MHPSSYDRMKRFIEENELADGKTVVDLGSYDYNGSYRPLFTGTKYIGVDIQSGHNVDIIFDSKAWHDLHDIDAVISGQTFEHIENIPDVLTKIKDILKPGGLLCIISPSTGPPRHYPIWRGNFTIEEMTGFVEGAGFIVESCEIAETPIFNDLCCVAHKETGEKTEKPEVTKRGKKVSNEAVL